MKFYLSVDALYNPTIYNAHVPLWNYIIIRAQIFLVYFIAGLKKLDPDWVAGYSMQNLAQHWMFYPFKFTLTESQIDYFVVHLGGLTIDLFVGFFLIYPKSRPYALFLSSTFHAMNSQIFAIGMFPYAMLGVQLIFCDPAWPRKLFELIPPSLRLLTPENSVEEIQTSYHCVYQNDDIQNQMYEDSSSSEVKSPTKPNRRHKAVSALCVAFIAWQCFLPYSHGISKGYNNWTNGLYGYSWDMMVHSWYVQHVRITYKDKDTNQSGYLDPMVWTGGKKRWSSHADMIKQYAQCIAHNLKAYDIHNVEIYFDIWRSLNSRFQQRMVDPRVDLLQAEWSPFTTTKWMMPLMVDLSDWRRRLADIQAALDHDTSLAESPPDVVFIADFPGLHLENYVQPDFGNTSLSVLAGTVVVTLTEMGKDVHLGPGESMQIPADTIHSVQTVSNSPSSYMYTFVNTTEVQFLKQYAKFEADMKNNTLKENEVLKKYSKDPYLSHYQQLMRAKTSEDVNTEPSLLQQFMSFLRNKYNILRRSIRMSHGAVYCLATNSNFSDFLNATYQWENRQVGGVTAASAV